MFRRILGLVIVLGASGLARPADSVLLHIGIMESMSEDAPRNVREVFGPNYGQLVKDYAGFDAVILQGLDPFLAATQLEHGKWHLGLFNGVEFAWVQREFPHLRPLVLVVNRQRLLRALLVAKKESDVKSFDDLEERDVYLLHTKRHCRLYAAKLLRGKSRERFKLFQARIGDDALDGILLGKVDAAIVDNVALDSYKEINPGRFNRLKIVAQSEPFPAPVILYREDNLTDAMLDKLRKGLCRINKTEMGRERLSELRITSFEPVPADYQRMVEEIRKVYPEPAG